MSPKSRYQKIIFFVKIPGHALLFSDDKLLFPKHVEINCDEYLSCKILMRSVLVVVGLEKEIVRGTPLIERQYGSLDMMKYMAKSIIDRKVHIDLCWLYS